MSGRARHWRDGDFITNRKTDRRQRRTRTPEQRLHELTDKSFRRFPSGWSVRVGFLLPTRFLVADGDHGHGVYVWKGFVQVAADSSEQAFSKAATFLRAIAKDSPSFTMLGSIAKATLPREHFTRNLTFIGNALIVTSARIDPLIFEAA